MVKRIKLILLLLVFTSLFMVETSQSFAATFLPNRNDTVSGSKIRVYDSEIPDYYKFINGRFGFSIDFPRNFNNGFLPENNDGATFKTRDGSASLSVWGSHNVAGWTVDDFFYDDQQQGYASRGEDWYVVSWEKDGIIYYKKQFITEQYSNGFIISYPKSQKDDFDSIVANIERTFVPGWKK